LHEVHALLYEPDGCGFKEALVRRFDAVEGDCLLLDYVVLHPRWRGLRLGLLAIRQAVDVLGGGCGLAVCDVAPLDPGAHASLGVPESWIPRHDTPRARREATVKLRRYARLMGFVRLGPTPYYALPLNDVTPTAAELLRAAPARRPDPS
jgi:hypothetical protein